MRHLALRTSPPFDFIPKPHQEDFEQFILDLYCDTTEGFWGKIPSFDASIFPDINPSFILAGIWADVHKDDYYLIKQTEGKLLPILHEPWCHANLNNIAEAFPDEFNYYLVMCGQDAMNVLDFHNMFYARTVGIDSTGQVYQGFTKFPIVQVW